MPKKEKKDLTFEYVAIANRIVEVVREKKRIHILKLSFETGFSIYKIRKAWEAVGDLFPDVDFFEDGYFEVVKQR